MNLSLFSSAGLEMIFAWVHFLAGIAWIGMLYFFNFVQVPYMAEADAVSKPSYMTKLLPRALWWFRWGALFTLISGLSIVGVWMATMGPSIMSSSRGVGISIGMLLGILMAANVWFVIWPKQKIVIASETAKAAGGQADPAQPDAAARAFIASRTNTLFSIPMLFFMGAASRLSFFGGEPAMSPGVPMGIIAAIVLLFEVNVFVGKKGQGMSKMLDKHVAVIHVGLVLALGFYFILDGML